MDSFLQEFEQLAHYVCTNFDAHMTARLIPICHETVTKGIRYVHRLPGNNTETKSCCPLVMDSFLQEFEQLAHYVCTNFDAHMTARLIPICHETVTKGIRYVHRLPGNNTETKSCCPLVMDSFL